MSTHTHAHIQGVVCLFLFMVFQVFHFEQKFETLKTNKRKTKTPKQHKLHNPIPYRWHFNILPRMMMLHVDFFLYYSNCE
jgi:hypothetical protein